jgi:hypothetical protein
MSLQRVLFNGVPVWKSPEGNLYYYESSTQPPMNQRILIGTEADGIYPNLKDTLEPYLRAYREGQEVRTRAVKK